MKTFSIYLSILAACIFMLTACNKEETTTQTVEIPHSSAIGQATIKGTVTYYDNVTGTDKPAPGAIIKIANDTVAKAYNQFWMTDTAGTFSVKGLGVGNYYIMAQYTDKMNFTYTTAGYTLVVKNGVDDVTLNFNCK